MATQPVEAYHPVIPISYNRRVSIQRRGNNVTNDGGYGQAGAYAAHIADVPAHIEETSQTKSDLYDGVRYPSAGTAVFPPYLDINVDDRIIDGSRTYEILRAHPVWATINIARFIRCEWREVQQ
jgi:hypothetical protein